MGITHLLNRRLTVSRTGYVDDDSGGQAVTTAVVGDVAARVSRPAPAEREVAAREGVRVSHTIYLDADADVARGDILTGGGQTFEVISVVAPSVRAYLIAAAREDVPA